MAPLSLPTPWLSSDPWITCSRSHEIFKNPHTFSTCNPTFC